MKISRIAAVLGVALMTTVAAGPWELSLGLVARSVGDFDIKSDVFVNPAFPDSPYVTGILGYDGQPALALLADPDRQGRVLGNVATLHSMDFAGVSEGLDTSLGVLLAARTPLGEKWDREWFLGLSFLWFGSDVSASSDEVAGTSHHFTADPLSWDALGGPNTVVVGSGAGSDMGGVYGAYNIGLDLDAYTFGVGIGTDVVLPFGSLRLEVGPTLTVVDYKAEASVDVRWESDDVPVFAGNRTKDSGVEFLLGFYGDFSFVYDFNERFGVGIGVRYDYLFEKLNTDLGDADLSGVSGSVKAVFRF